MNSENRLNQVWWALRIGLGMMALLAGADKFTNLLTNWQMYLSPVVPRLAHLSAATVMQLIGVVEMAAGVLVLSGRATRWGAYIVMLWLTGVALSLVAQGGFFDIAVRDLELALAAFALARVTEVRESALARNQRPAYAASSQAAA
jgi:uncharacterized membrane protein YphA (DoxX/SURF4 family)